MNCPVCDTEGSGAYCARCGAPLEGAACRACDEPLVAGARYCTRCGLVVRKDAGALPWYVAGGAVAALVGFLAIAAARSGEAPGDLRSPPRDAPLALPAERPPALTGSPIEQADRLFNRVMQAQAAGDSAEVRFFMPMAIAAYQNAGSLDADGFYHLAVLQLSAGDAGSAAATAGEILRDAPTHLLGRGLAAEAAEALGDWEAALRHSERLLSAFEAETASQLPEYRHHEAMLSLYRSAAERRVAASRGP